MQCEKCHGGRMEDVKIFRLHGCLVAIGFGVLAACVLLLILAVLVKSRQSAAASAVERAQTRAKAEALSQLRALNVPAPVVSDFEPDAGLSGPSWALLSPAQSNEVRRIESEHQLKLDGAAGVRSAVGIIGGGLFVLFLAVALPGIVIGLLLLLRKKVWRCEACGYFFDRA